jgi:hypothetical protein
MGVDAAQTLLTGDAFGIGAEPLQTVVRTGVGDVEVGAKLQLINTLRDRLDPPPGLAVRSAIAGVVRLGTGSPDTPDNLVDIGTGNGQTDVEVRSQLDLILGRRFWMSAVGRYGVQLADERAMRITAPDQPLAPAHTRQLVRRDLGDYLEVELTPRYVLNDYVALSAQAFYRRKARDEYSGTFDVSNSLGEPVTLDASILDLETEQREARFVAGLTYSTLASHQRGHARIPVEVTIQHAESLWGQGGNTPRIRQTRLALRVYASPIGARARR